MHRCADGSDRTEHISQMERARRVTLCYSSLANLSLLRTTHDIIWHLDHLELVVDNLRELKQKVEEQNIEYIQRYTERYLCSMRTVTNCLISDEAVETFLDEGSDDHQVGKEILSLLEYFNFDFSKNVDSGRFTF